MGRGDSPAHVDDEGESVNLRLLRKPRGNRGHNRALREPKDPVERAVLQESILQEPADPESNDSIWEREREKREKREIERD